MRGVQKQQLVVKKMVSLKQRKPEKKGQRKQKGLPQVGRCVLEEQHLPSMEQHKFEVVKEMRKELSGLGV